MKIQILDENISKQKVTFFFFFNPLVWAKIKKNKRIFMTQVWSKLKAKEILTLFNHPFPLWESKLDTLQNSEDLLSPKGSKFPKKISPPRRRIKGSLTFSSDGIP